MLSLVLLILKYEQLNKNIAIIGYDLMIFLLLTSLVYVGAAILKSEISWFDDINNTSSMLSSRLETDATFLRTIIVDRSTILLQNVGLVVAAFIVAFMLNWRITLVVLATYPLIISGHISEVSSSSIFLYYQTSTFICVLTSGCQNFRNYSCKGLVAT